MFSKRNSSEPFAFWLIDELFGSDEEDAEEMQPMSNREVYFSMVIITVVFILLSYLVKVLLA